MVLLAKTIRRKADMYLIQEYRRLFSANTQNKNHKRNSAFANNLKDFILNSFGVQRTLNKMAN